GGDAGSAADNQRRLDGRGGRQGPLHRLGLVIAPGDTVSKLLWTKEQFPQLFERSDKVLLPHDYLNYWLTGRYCTEVGDASGTGYFTVRTREWDLPLAAHIDPGGRLGKALPQLWQAHGPVGVLRPEAARVLSRNPDAPVSSGGGGRR
ncbi:xylulokinase, partial [Pseudomonas syringae]